MRHIIVLLLLGIPALSGCKCTRVAGAAFKIPPEEVVRQKVEEGLKTANDLATSACGLPATGLTNITLSSYKRDTAIPWSGTVHFKGAPVNAKNAAKTLACIGVVTYTIHSISNLKGEVTGWELQRLELESVETPGIKWTKPPPPPSDDWDWD